MTKEAYEKTDAECALKEALNRVEELENGIRHLKTEFFRGDSKCWLDIEELCKLLPEGYAPPERDTFCELENCKKYIASCHDPRVKYTSPQKRIEELEAELKLLKLTNNQLERRIYEAWRSREED